MADLCCYAERCTYNKEHLCCKGDIMVGGKNAENSGETCCESFLERKENSYTSSMEHPSTTISIDCEAKNCTHNSNYKCHAQNVEIENPKACCCSDTACGTFKQTS